MVFVSDDIPPELRRVVEFLNAQVNPAEIIAIEVKQYVGADGIKALVPRVIGQTAKVEARKCRRTTPRGRRLGRERCSPAFASAWRSTPRKASSTGLTPSRAWTFAIPMRAA